MNVLILETTPLLLSEHWALSLTRSDARVLEMYERHYSANPVKNGKRKEIGPPGHYIALMTASLDALFVWSRERYRRDGQTGINCTVFRNESNVLSSILIQEAMQIAWKRWPGIRLFTFVNGQKIRSVNPGYCFKVAGWRTCGLTKTGLVILEADN